ncbi:MAG: 2,3-bisphosphoglycerate-independent phosphoglycerate mutase [Clostridia bacterium]|nr:2,3-bisphosphoglycerate-independent phosphoglycerate mutase [Clostridia bacterium]
MRKGILVILDGYGEGKPNDFNAVSNANTPTLNRLKTLSHSLLKTHGESVGLFEEEMGGSEVGHTTIGAGRVVKSTAKQIRDDILSGEFHKDKTINSMLDDLKKKKADLHLIGLMSDKNIHSNIEHCLEIIKMAKDKAQNIFIHFITDGRDAGVFESLKYLKQLQNHIKNIKNCHILSVSGRFYAMDRENHEERINKAFNAMFCANNTTKDVQEYIKNQHKAGNNDQMIEPASLKIETFTGVKKEDCVFFFNFREDRLRQMVKKCEELNCTMLTMADVGGVNAKSVYSNKIIENTMSQFLSENGLKQVKISESTKYAHVTYFLNGGREEPFENEYRIHVPSLKTNDFSKTPNMQAKKITNNVKKAIKKQYDAIIVNYSNADMIGHTGDYSAVVQSLEYLDKCLQKVLKMAKKQGYFVLVTADHGNSEQMKNNNGEPNTAHTINRVICVVDDEKNKMKKYGELKDVAPTFVELLGLKPSKHFEGKSLILK